MRYVSDKSCTKNQKTHFMLSNFFLSPKFMPFMK